MNKKGFTLLLSAVLIIATMAVMVSASGWQQSQMGGMNARNCREEVGGYIEQKVVG